MASTKKYWKNEAELNPDDSIINTLRHNEFPEEIPVDEFLGNKDSLSEGNTSRRDFLKYVGFSTAAASLAACEGPVRKSIPYVVKPESIIPGIANYYASTIANGYDFASILVKTREGRPIKIERNGDAKVGNGSSARIQASVLSLYDSSRLQGPKSGDQDISWEVLDATVKSKLNALKGTGRQIVFLTQTYASPTTAKLMAEFVAEYPNTKHITYDAISEDAALTAFEAKYGSWALPDYDFGKADVIVSFGADFLADWQGGDFASSYAKGRVPKNGKMSKHIQFESNMTLTGANADHRIPLSPSQQRKALAVLFGKLNGTSVNTDLSEDVMAHVNAAASAIGNAGSKALVVTGIDDIHAQSLALAINEMTGSEAVDSEAPRNIRQGSSADMAQLVQDMNAGQVGLLIMDGINPGYTWPDSEAFVSGLSQVDVSVTFSTNQNETTVASKYTAAANHYLESWGDAELKKGHYSLMQPVIKQLFDTRQLQSSVLKWLGKEESYYEYLKASWETDILNGDPWEQTLQAGVFSGTLSEDPVIEETEVTPPLASVDVSDDAPEQGGMDAMTEAVNALAGSTAADGYELTLYSKTGMGDGQMANNPWLQEFPDPITRVTWDNYLTISKADAQALGLENRNVANGGLDGSYVNISANGVNISNVPVVIQPGQAEGSVGLSFGFGRKIGMKEEMQTGVNAYALYKECSTTQDVSIEKASGIHEFACIQLHNTLMGRGDIIKETTLETYNTKDASEWNHVPQVSLDHQEVPATTVDLWDSFDRSIGHHFNMSIDLNACTGCGACVVACHAENNVPVVGKKEVRLSRDMHGLRIDRYYSSEETFAEDVEKKDGLSGAVGSKRGFGEMEDPAANPTVAFQPVMCQHCNHAPCETVCPVAATTHSRQGQNHMAYNRCVGTRANNCPYKVRRFNWFLYSDNEEFDFHFNDDLGKMVINPDVTVRSRGVIEKCSLCIQMTQKSILDAKREGREVRDEEFQTACSNACDTGAIVFGDSNNKESEVSKLKESNRVYHLLESVGTQPNVFYHVKVRNTDDA